MESKQYNLFLNKQAVESNDNVEKREYSDIVVSGRTSDQRSPFWLPDSLPGMNLFGIWCKGSCLRGSRMFVGMARLWGALREGKMALWGGKGGVLGGGMRQGGCRCGSFKDGAEV